MNIYTTRPPLVETQKTFREYVTAIHLDPKELTQEEIESQYPDGLPSQLPEEITESEASSSSLSLSSISLADSQDIRLWTATDYFLYHNTPRPDMTEVRKIIEDHINAKTDEKILSGFTWTILHGEHAGQTVNVWLSMENQNNYKAFHDAARDYPTQVSFPVKYKISEDENKKAIYEVFDSFAELSMFYLGAVAYIKRTLEEGWAMKDSIEI